MSYETAKEEFRVARNSFILAYKTYLEKLLALLEANIQSVNNIDVKNALVDVANDVIAVKESALETSTGTQPLQYFEKNEESSMESAAVSGTDTTMGGRPLIFAPTKSDNDNIISAFYTYRYHNAEFRQMFQGDNVNNANSSNSCQNNNSSCAIETDLPQHKNSASTRVQPERSIVHIDETVKRVKSLNAEWFSALASALSRVFQRTVLDMSESNAEIPDCPAASDYVDFTSLFGNRASRSARLRSVIQSVYFKLQVTGFDSGYHPKLWARLFSMPLQNGDKFRKEPSFLFSSIPRLDSLPDVIKKETEVMLRCLDILSHLSTASA